MGSCNIFPETPPWPVQGSVVIRHKQAAAAKPCSDGAAVTRTATVLPVLHVDIIKDDFWLEHPALLA